MTAPRVIVVAKGSSYARFIEDERDPRAKALLKRHDESVANWLAGHAAHSRTLERVQMALSRFGVHAVVVRRPHAEFDATDADLVIAVGGDGTLLAASHNVGSVPLLGVNSDPERSVGFYCAGRGEELEATLERALAGRLPATWLTRMEVTLNGRVRSRRVLNEALYSHCSPAATSRYILRYGSVSEEQRSSGVWVGPAAGSTAAQYSAGGEILPLRSKRLQLVVREPFLWEGRKTRFRRLLVGPGKSVGLKSKMHDAALYLDGPYRRISVSLGDVAQFSASNEPLCVLGLEHDARARPRRARAGKT
ncbi:MAG: NAD(+)/NADH kinase [Polyangiaceae bacterium]|nr:NAD(+)/NADH kinase [Polyangiaceae bacterium]